MLSLSRSLRSSCLPVGHLVLSSCILVGLATACGEDPTFDASSLDTEDGSTAPAKGADGGRLNGDASTTDARASDPTTDDGSAPNDAGGGDATTAPDGADAGNEAGTWLPIPGASCTTIGELYERACGQCGKQTASCSPSKIVTGFGQCTEPASVERRAASATSPASGSRSPAKAKSWRPIDARPARRRTAPRAAQEGSHDRGPATRRAPGVLRA